MSLVGDATTVSQNRLQEIKFSDDCYMCLLPAPHNGLPSSASALVLRSLIQVQRSQIRRIFLREGVRWRRTHSWGTSRDKDFVPKE